MFDFYYIAYFISPADLRENIKNDKGFFATLKVLHSIVFLILQNANNKEGSRGFGAAIDILIFSWGFCAAIDEGCWAFWVFSLNANCVFHRYENDSIVYFSEINYAVVGILKRAFSFYTVSFFFFHILHTNLPGNLLCLVFTFCIHYILHTYSPGK